tara:strand:+ start:454 stop:708 length:255 start_codon:yes stop_codon:yes gene_type:complete
MHRGTSIPLDAAVDDMVETMARAAHVRAAALLFDSDDRKMPEWDELKPETKAFSTDCMRHAYIALVVRCGADVEEIPEIGGGLA